VDNILDLSVVIVSFNCRDLLVRCLKSLKIPPHNPQEVIIIDNASIDGTPDIIPEIYPTAKIIRNKTNIGHAKAVNQGLRMVSCDKILILDADTEMKDNAIKIMVDFLNQHPHVDMIAPKIIYPDGTVQRTSRNFPKPINAIFGRQSFLSKIFPNNPFTRRFLMLDVIDDNRPHPVEFISAACMMFRKALIDKLGLWDEGYMAYWVDADWCKRVRKSGGIIYYLPQATVIHHEQNRRNTKKSPARIIYFHKGAFRFYRRHYVWGIWEPRVIIAALLLALRASFLIVGNAFKKSSAIEYDPLIKLRKE